MKLNIIDHRALRVEDVLYDMRQTRERIRGKAAYVEFNATYPGQWRPPAAYAVDSIFRHLINHAIKTH
jgi:hypothetical protein